MNLNEIAKKLIAGKYFPGIIIGITENLDWTFSPDETKFSTPLSELEPTGKWQNDRVIEAWIDDEELDDDDRITAEQTLAYMIRNWLAKELCCLADNAYRDHGIEPGGFSGGQWEEDPNANCDWAFDTSGQIISGGYYKSFADVKQEIDGAAKEAAEQKSRME